MASMVCIPDVGEGIQIALSHPAKSIPSHCPLPVFSTDPWPVCSLESVNWLGRRNSVFRGKNPNVPREGIPGFACPPSIPEWILLGKPKQKKRGLFGLSVPTIYPWKNPKGAHPSPGVFAFLVNTLAKALSG